MAMLVIMAALSFQALASESDLAGPELDAGCEQVLSTTMNRAFAKSSSDSGLLPFTIGTDTFLLDVDPFEIFAEGQKKVRIRENGTIVREEALDIAMYEGTIQGIPGSEARYTVSPYGMRGTLFDGRRTFSLMPPDSAVDRESSPEPPPYADDVFEIVAVVLDPSTCPREGGYTGTEIAVEATPATNFQIAEVEPFADGRFANKKTDFADRIVNAFAEQSKMWKAETGNKIVLLGIDAFGEFSDSSNCNTHLDDFHRIRGNSALRGAPVDSYVLFTGKDLSGCTGVAYAGAAGALSSKPSAVVEAIDHDSWDSYDPDESDDLGLTVGHEIGHNWGEPNHPSKKYCVWETWGKCWHHFYNIMATEVDEDHQDFYFTANSITRIRGATNGKF